MSAFKSVSIIVDVPLGAYCWDDNGPCEYFCNEGGQGRCTLGVGFRIEEQRNKNAHVYFKDPNCAKLTEVTK